MRTAYRTQPRALRGLTVVVAAVIAALTLTFVPGPAHAATGSFTDPKRDTAAGNIGDIVKVTYKAGWYWNAFDIRFRKWEPHWTKIYIDTGLGHRGPEFVATIDHEQFWRTVTVRRTQLDHPWRDGRQVCSNKHNRWQDRHFTGRFGLGCLRSRAGKLPHRVRVNVASEVIWYTKPGSAFDYARGRTSFGPWVAVARHP